MGSSRDVNPQRIPRRVRGGPRNYAVRQRGFEGQPPGRGQAPRATGPHANACCAATTSMTLTKSRGFSATRPTSFTRRSGFVARHAGLRLPGEALGIRWGAVDFSTGILRPYDNWVRSDQLDTTKTADSEAIPMTPRLDRALATIKQRGYASG